MADQGHVEEPKNFAPKTPVNLAPPKDDPITPDELSKCDGSFNHPPLRDLHRRKVERDKRQGGNSHSHLLLHPGSDPSKPTLVAIKGTVFDVSGNEAYAPKGQYHGQSVLSHPTTYYPHTLQKHTPSIHHRSPHGRLKRHTHPP